MNHARVLLIPILLTFSSCRKPESSSASAPAVPPGSVSNSGFAKRALVETIKEMALPADEPAGIVTFSGDHRSIARVMFVGKTRPIPAEHKTAILLAEKKTGTVPLADDVKNELLFREGADDYWMPVGTKTEPEFQSLKPGQVIDLYASFVAAVKPKAGKTEFVFVAQEYGDVSKDPVQ